MLALHFDGRTARVSGVDPPALHALETGRVDVRSLISERIPLRDGLEALRIADTPGTLKVLIETA